MPTASPSLLSPLWQMPPLAPGGMLGGMDPMELMRLAQAAPLVAPRTSDELDRADQRWLRSLQSEPTAPPSPGPAPAQQPAPDPSMWQRFMALMSQTA